MRVKQVLVVVTVTVLGVVLAGNFAGAQGAEGSAVILGTVASDPGTTASVPFYYSRGSGPSLRSLRLHVDFVSNSVKFAKADKGMAAETQDYDLAVEMEDLPANERDLPRTRLKVAVTLLDATTSIPEGLLAFLNFRIAPESKPFTILLQPADAEAQDTSQKPAPLAVEPGKVIIAGPDEPMPGCFIYTH